MTIQVRTCLGRFGDQLFGRAIRRQTFAFAFRLELNVGTGGFVDR